MGLLCWYANLRKATKYNPIKKKLTCISAFNLCLTKQISMINMIETVTGLPNNENILLMILIIGWSRLVWMTLMIQRPSW